MLIHESHVFELWINLIEVLSVWSSQFFQHHLCSDEEILIPAWSWIKCENYVCGKTRKQNNIVNLILKSVQTDKTLPKVMDVKVMHVVKQESKTTSPNLLFQNQ